MKQATRAPLFAPSTPEPAPDVARHAAFWETRAERLPVGLFQTDAAGSCVYVNSRWCELTGLTAADAPGAGWVRALHPDDRERIFTAWSRAAETAAPFADEYRFLHPDASVVWVYGQATPEVDDSGAVVAFVGSVTDITQRHQAEERLRASEAHLAALINQSISGIAETDLNGRFTLVNDRYCEITGYTRDELTDGLRMQEITHPDDLPGNSELFQRLVGDGAPFAIEKRYIHKDGSIVWVNNSVSAIRDESGLPHSAVAVVTDVSERKRAEDALRTSEARFRALAAATTDAIWTIDTTGEVRDEPTTRWPFVTDLPPEAIAAEWLAAVHPDDRAPGDAVWRAAIAEGRPVEFEQRIRQRDGSYRHFAVRAVPVHDEDGAIREWVGADVDITERKAAENELRENEERLRLGVEVAGFALAEIDYAENVIRLSAEAARLYGLANDAVTLPRDQVHAAFHPDDRDALKRRIAVAPDPNAEPSYTTEYRVRWPTGEVRWLSVRKQVIFDRSADAPRPVRAMLAALDITARVRAEEDRQALLDALAHDLKNPLTAMKMQAQLLLRQIDRRGVPHRDALIERVAGFAALATRMTELIDELDEHARVALGVGLTPDRRPTDLVAIVRGSVAEILRTEGAHPIRLETTETDLVGLWDEGQLRRVLENLLTNAVKYSPPASEILVELERDGRYALLRVSDTGIGIPLADQPHVFAFRRRGGNVGAITGSGVGLAGVKRIVEQHGGMVSVQSVEGRGSTFTVRLPLMGRGR